MFINHANQSDLTEILALQKLAYQENAARYNDPCIPPLTQTLDELIEQTKSHIFLKAVVDDTIVGSVRGCEHDGYAKKRRDVNIRRETPADYAEVCELVKTAFAANPDDDGSTHEYLNELRTKDSFIPELSLVAEAGDGSIIGQIVLYKTAVAADSGEFTELVLSPICVHPNHFRRGIARAMTGKALRIAAEMGFRAVFLCGDPAVYGRLGFAPSKQYGIYHKKDKDAEWSMVRELYGGALDGITGTVDTV